MHDFIKNMRSIKSMRMMEIERIENFYKNYSMFVAPNYVESLNDTIWKGEKANGNIKLNLLDKEGNALTSLYMREEDGFIIVSESASEACILKCKENILDLLKIFEENNIRYKNKISILQ